MEISINKSEFNYANTNYTTLDMLLDNKNVSVTFNNKNNSVNVLYKNAMARVYKGSGKTFNSIDEAIASYKDAKIISMLNAAKFN